MDSGTRARRRRRALGARGAADRKGDMVAVGDKEDGSEGIFVQTQLRSARRRSRRVQVHVERSVARKADRLRAHGAAADRGEGARRLSDLGHRPRARALARARRHGLVHRQRLRRRAARRQRRRGARHRSVDLRHHARHDEHRRDHAGRPRAAHARHQPGARRRLDRQRGGAGDHHRRHHARVREAQRCRSCSPARFATTVRCPTSSPTRSRRRTRCAQHAIKATMAILVATALHAIATGNMLPAFVAAARRQHARAADDLRRLVGVRREQAEGPRHASGVRRRHERTGFHAHPAAVRRARARGPRASSRARPEAAAR